MLNRKDNLFSEDGKPLVSIVEDDGNLKRTVAAALDEIGGLSRLVKPGDTVLLKPNYVSGDPPPASSDPAFIRSVVELLFDHGASRVVVGESSSRATRRVLTKTGMLETVEAAGADVVIFDEGRWIEVEVGGRFLKRIALAEEALRTEKIIYLPCLKTHNWARFTMSLKLPFGFVRRRDRWAMHLHIQEKIAELNTVVHPDLIIMDGRKCFISGGPSKGVTREPGLVLASGDRVSIDAEGMRIIKEFPGNSLKKDVWDYAQLRHAIKLGLGQSGWDAHSTIVRRNTAPLASGRTAG